MTDEPNIKNDAAYEALTTVEDVQLAQEEDRAVQILVPGHDEWLQTFVTDAPTIAGDLAGGYKFRALQAD